ncbi:hypothetical protein K4K59_000760 [Colletotrichum sp. SAR11_240]|nr:hypothetical protein K4K59_000760 [Colletotrichum sp. SAR11_240]
MGKLYYFQAPNFDVNPESEAAPKLGSIFAKLDHLAAPLNQHERLTIPENLINRNANTDFSEARNRSLQTEIGINVTSAQGIVGSGDLIYAFSQDKDATFSCELLETVEFAPDSEFVTASILASQRVQRFLENSIFGRKRVYMITGLKIASGFSKSIATETQHSPSLKAAVSGAAIGMPVDAGPKLGLTIEQGRTVTHGKTLNKIVFAYKVIRIKVRWDGEARYKYKSGGKYTVDDSSDDSDEENKGKWVMESLGEDEILKDFPELAKVKIQHD